MSLDIIELGPDQAELLQEVLDVFAVAFDDAGNYRENRPGAEYHRALLGSDYFICLAARWQGRIVGALAAYELKKFERRRSEIYIYDLAVLPEARRRGVATAMISALKGIGKARGAYVIFVQADTGEEDIPAIELYTKLGKREEVLHFDIDIE